METRSTSSGYRRREISGHSRPHPLRLGNVPARAGHRLQRKRRSLQGRRRTDPGTTPVTITRDSGGQITQIEDPSGLSLFYDYGNYAADGTKITPDDGLGNLGRVRLRDNTQIVYTYTDPAFPHHLTEVYDDAEIAVLTVDFDDEGYRSQIVDASGLATTLSFNMALGNGKSVSRTDDGAGRVIDEVRDARGSLLRTVQSLDSNPDPSQQRFLVTVFRYNLRGLMTHRSTPFVVTGAENRYSKVPAEP